MNSRVVEFGVFASALSIVLLAQITLSTMPWQPAASDFSQLHADLSALLHGEHLYDEASHQKYLQLHEINGEPVKLLAPGYPPWYYITALPLAFLPRIPAAQVWGLLTALTIAASVFLLIPKAPALLRSFISVLAILYGPALLQIHIGQQTTVVLLGLALALEGLRTSRAVLTGVGMSLLTFKPSIGILLLAPTLWYLMAAGKQLARRSILTTVCILGALSAIAWALDPSALRDYPDALQRLNVEPVNRRCDTCSSIPIMLESFGILPRGAWNGRFISGSVLFLALLVLPLYQARHAAVSWYLALSTCAAMLAAPYLRNYDFVILLFPLIVVPQLALETAGIGHRSGSIALMLIALILSWGVIYAAPRELQSPLLWLAPLALYASLAAMAQGAASSRRQ